MTNLKKSLFWVSFYLLIVLVLGQLDRADTPIINFASYFYIAAVLVVPIMVFIPSLHKVSVYVPVVFWGAVYFSLSRIIDRTLTSTSDVVVALLEFIFLEVGVWLSYQLAVAIGHSESLMDVLAQGTFPNRAIRVDQAAEQIRTEFARSRRYHRPLSLIVVTSSVYKEEVSKEVLKTLQRDMLSRLSYARIGQSVGEEIRQTDILMQDHGGRFLVLCPETPLESAVRLSERICSALKEETGLRVMCGVASFPDEALNFEDLLYTARERANKLKHFSALENSNKV